MMFAVLMAVPVAFGPSFYDYMGWDLWSVLTFIMFYAAVLMILILIVMPVLPLKWNPVEVTDTSAVERDE